MLRENCLGTVKLSKRFPSESAIDTLSIAVFGIAD